MWRENGLFVLQCAAKETFLDVHNFHENIGYPLTLMVGPSGAGKSTYLRNVVGMESVISSDTIRQHLCGDYRDQSQNERVFEAMHSLAKERLKHGLPVILDATNIRRADRIKAAKLIPDTFAVNYVVIDRPLEEKLKTAGWRSTVSVKGKELVRYHHEVMQNNLKDILKGDDLPNVKVTDLRKK
jgi:protein phosphatase